MIPIIAPREARRLLRNRFPESRNRVPVFLFPWRPSYCHVFPWSIEVSIDRVSDITDTLHPKFPEMSETSSDL
jgi:hypothetical protein